MRTLVRKLGLVLSVFPLSVAAVGGMWGFAPAPARAATTVIEAETLRVPANAGIFSDPAASGGRALGLYANASVQAGQVPAGSTVTVRARGSSCVGSAQLAVSAGGSVLKTFSLGQGWSQYSVAVPQSGVLQVSFVNDFRTFWCDRNAYLDTVSVDSPGGPVDPGGPSGTDKCPGGFMAEYRNSVVPGQGPVVASECVNAPGGYWDSTAPRAGVSADGFSITYTGTVTVRSAGDYQLAVVAADTRVGASVDGVIKVSPTASDDWRNSYVTVPLAAGKHTVVYTLADGGGSAGGSFSLSPVRADAATTGDRPFSNSSFWNTPVPVSAPVDPSSQRWVSLLGSRVDGFTMNRTVWSPGLYRATAQTPLRSITIGNQGNGRIQVPMEAGFVPTNDTDSSVSVVDASRTCVYEFINYSPSRAWANGVAVYRYRGDGAHTGEAAHAGGELPFTAGVITPADMASGRIEHALRFASPVASRTFVYPGTRTDGTTEGGIPQGQRMRLDPSFDVEGSGLSPAQKMVARALQTYGAYNADGAATLAIYAQAFATFPAGLEPQGLPASVLARMQFLAPQYSSTDIAMDSPVTPGCTQVVR